MRSRLLGIAAVMLAFLALACGGDDNGNGGNANGNGANGGGNGDGAQIGGHAVTEVMHMGGYDTTAGQYADNWRQVFANAEPADAEQFCADMQDVNPFEARLYYFNRTDEYFGGESDPPPDATPVADQTADGTSLQTAIDIIRAVCIDSDLLG